MGTSGTSITYTPSDATIDISYVSGWNADDLEFIAFEDIATYLTYDTSVAGIITFALGSGGSTPSFVIYLNINGQIVTITSVGA